MTGTKNFFLLNQHYREYKQVKELITECEKAMDEILYIHFFNSEIALGQIPSHKTALNKKNTPCVDFQEYSFRYFGGVYLFTIKGINQNTLLTLMAEVGTDITKFRSSKAFANWLHICPNEKVTGGKVISNRTKRGSNPLSQILKSAGNAIGNMKTGGAIVTLFKKVAYKNGRKEAIMATAHKLAVIIYNIRPLQGKRAIIFS